MKPKKLFTFAVLLVVLALFVVACQSEPETETVEVEVTRIVTETITEEGQEVEVTRIVTETQTETVTEQVEVVVTATPEPIEQTLNAALGVGPGGDEDGRPWSGGAGHTTHVKQFVTPTIFNPELTEVIAYGADSWESNEDFTVWTYHLRDDLNWSDGAPVTANDWKFTADLVTSPDFDTTQLAHRNLAFQDVVGFEEHIAGEADELAGVQVIDDKTIEYTLTSSNPRHFTNQYRTYILPEHAIDFGPAEYLTTDWFRNSEKMVGSGPFLVSDYEPDQYMILVKNPNYFEGEPKLDEIVIRFFGGDITAAVLALAAGEIDFTYVDPTDTATLPGGFEIFSAPSNVIVYLDLHYTNIDEHFQDIRVRQALLHAIDREAITEQVLQGTYYALPCPVPLPGLWPDDLNPYEYDPAKATALLEEAGVDPADISMNWVGHSGYDNILNNSALQAVQAYLGEIGITDVTYQFQDIPTFREGYKADGPWQFQYRGWGYPPYGADPGGKWSNSGSQGGDFKGYDMVAEGFEDAIDKIKTAPTTEEYFAAMSEFCTLHNEKLPDLQLWVGNRYGAAKDTIDGFYWQPAGGGGPYKDDSHLWEMTQ